MATISKDFELSSVDREVVVRGLQTLRASVSRAHNTERDSAVKAIRKAEMDSIDALIVRFRPA